MGILVKYCKPEHNLSHGCTTLRLGTLEYYRELDPERHIADVWEGREKINMSNMKTETASSGARKAIQGFLPDGPYIHYSGKFEIRNTFSNSYIFCCSILNNQNPKEHARRFNEEYTSCYQITDVNEFVQRLAKMLNHHIRLNHFSDVSQEKLNGVSIQEWGINLGYYHNPVRYVPDKISQIENGEMKTYIQEIPYPYRSVFVKPQKYAEDNEYRIVFTMQHPRFGVLEMQKEPVDLPILPVDNVPLS